MSTGHSVIPTQSTRQDSSDPSLEALYVEDQASSTRMSNRGEKQSDSSQSNPLGHQTHRAHSPSPKHGLMPHHNKGLDRDGDKISSQGVHQTIHRSGVDSDGLFDSAHPSAFPSTKHKMPSNGEEKSHEPEINIGELPKHDRFNGPVEYLEDDHTISQHDPQHSHGAPSSAVLGAGAGLVSLGAAAAAASHHISNPPAVNYAAYDAPMAHHDDSSSRTAAPQGSFFTQPATHHGGPSHTKSNHNYGLGSSAHSGTSVPHPSSALAHHSVPASSILDAHNEHTSPSSSHVSRGPAHVVAAPILLASAAINHHNSSQPAHRAPVHIEKSHEAYHGPTAQSAPAIGHSQQPVHVEAIHKPYHGDPMSASSTGMKESELRRAGSQSSTSTSKISPTPVSTAPKKKTWFGFEIRENEKRPPRPLSLGFGFKETRKAAMAAAKAGTAPPKASISAPISTPIMAPSAPPAISAQGVHASSANSSSSSSTPATVSAQGAHLTTNEGLSPLALAAISTQGVHAARNLGSSSGPAAISAQGVHAASNAGPTSSASVSNPSIVSVQPIHPLGRSSPAPHSFSPSQDRPVHPDISYHTKKKSKKADRSNLFSAPKVPAGMGRSHVPPKAPVSTTARVSSPAPVVASSSKIAPIPSSDTFSAHVAGLTSVPVHSQHQHHANSPMAPELLTAAIAAGAATAAISHHHGHSEEALLRATTGGTTAPSHGGVTSVAQSVSHDPTPSTSTAVHETVPFRSAGLSSTSSTLSQAPAAHAQSIPEKATAAHWILPHERATAATFKKPKVDLSLYPEEESTYPRGEESHHENPDHPDHPVVVQEIQLNADDQHAHSDLHLSKKAVAAAAVASGLGSIKSAFSNIQLPGRRKSDTPKEGVEGATSTTTPIAIASVDSPVVTAVPATTSTAAEKETVHTGNNFWSWTALTFKKEIAVFHCANMKSFNPLYTSQMAHL